MSQNTESAFLAVTVGKLLPYLRRYARALTGNQTAGDAHAAATLETLLEDRSFFEQGLSDKVALFRTFHLIWTHAGAPVSNSERGLAARAQRHLQTLTTNSREALLLHTIEDFSPAEIAQIIGTSIDDVKHLIAIARQDMENSVTGRILVIEDEAIIAMDLQDIVMEMGHDITGVARTHDAAVRLAGRDLPDLILSDIQLADGSSGIDAVNEILIAASDIPVIFITAFPERLLTGERPEPAFVITKPYSEQQVRSAVSQAMFFASTETLTA